ncbi:hypothetical protein [Sphingobacterium sp. Ag1]|uniref:hypothetical protein n=1 Tax=Sphingobacterium sp. Ag1 TaxID=1643451 RepID=UPI0012E0B671|nr:hypothetical protein [Sphingobacterium sp. Ag1]
MKKCTDDWRELRLIYDRDSTYFAQEDRYDTGMTLYYIPVIPLYTLLNKRQTSQVGKLLLSVYAYCYQVLKIEYYRNENCYLNWNYDRIQDWMESDGETEILEELKKAKKIGDIMKPKLCDPDNLATFETRLTNYLPTDDFGENCLQIATRFFNLFISHPNTAIDVKYYPLASREVLEYESYNVTLDNYLSFSADVNGHLHETLFTMVNDDLQEYGEIDEPTRFIPIDGRDIPDNNFEFEREVFSSINELIALMDF